MIKRFYLNDFIAKYVTERNSSLFEEDLAANKDAINNAVAGKSVLVIGGAGTIGSSFIKAMLVFEPAAVTVVDNNENGLAELVRDIRSNAAIKVPAKFITYPMDLASNVFKKILANNHFDIVANFAAHKHVRSEKDQFSVEAMITNNVLSAHYLLKALHKNPPAHFFCVSTDKAANPVNIMGASKKLMENVIFNSLDAVPVTTARFANVAFSNGSLPAGFLDRIQKRQPISAPSDVKRYFVSPAESGEICLLACVLGKPGEILFPKLAENEMKTFSQIAIDLLKEMDYEPVICNTEHEAKEMAVGLNDSSKKYPVYFFRSETTGEKPFEEFYTNEEQVDFDKFINLGIIKRTASDTAMDLNSCIRDIEQLFSKEHFTKLQIVEILEGAVPGFNHLETGKFLDEKM
ncbi:MAG: polysaccharide biosynthesis protein [Bacteroidota bacterium]